MTLFKILVFRDSRKVGFGAWLFIVATTLLAKGHIHAEDWMVCMMLSSALVGGGTLADRWMNGKNVVVSSTTTTSSDATAPRSK